MNTRDMRRMGVVSLFLFLVVLMSACGGDGGEDFLELPQTISTSNNIASIHFPEDWVAEGLPNAMRFANTQANLGAFPETLIGDQVTVRVDVIQNLVSGVDEDATLQEVLASYTAGDSPILGDTEEFNEDEQRSVIVSGTISFGTQTIGVIYAITNEDSAYGFLTLLAPQDSIAEYRDIARSMIITFDAEPPPIEGSGN